jgi:23S rRNA pseudouridine1911/1915/1917 synthase
VTEPPPIRLVAAAEHRGRRLDQVLAALPGLESRAEAQRLIAGGRVEVDGAPVRKRHTVADGETIVVRPLPAPVTDLTADEAVPFRVVLRDDHLVVVDKPAGVVVHPARGHATGTLVHGLLALGAAGGDDPTRPGIVHRLDRDTSGLLVVARTPRAHRRLQAMLRDRRVDRRYLALVHGEPPPALTIDRPIGRHPRDRTRMAVVADGREAVTHLFVQERLGPVTLCEVRLETGRTHQIRVHLEALGFPVVGDPVYGRRPVRWGLERQFLHAWSLTFPHPEDPDRIVRAESPLPPDLEGALGRARQAHARTR